MSGYVGFVAENFFQNYANWQSAYKDPVVVPGVNDRSAMVANAPYQAAGGYTGYPARSRVVTDLLSGAAREATQMASNPLAKTIVATPRSAAVASRTPGLFQQYDQNQTVKKQSIADFVAELIANKPKNRVARDQEAAAIESVYAKGAGSLQAELAANQKASRLATRTAAQQAMGRAGRDRNVGQMVGGNSSYLNRAYGDTLARIMADQAIKDSAIGRENILYTQGQRSNLLGQRGRLNDEMAGRELAPINALNSYQSGEAGLLASLAGIEDQNTDYDSYTPEQSIAKRLQLIQQIEQLESMGIDPSQFIGSGGGMQPTGQPRSVSSRLLN